MATLTDAHLEAMRCARLAAVIESRLPARGGDPEASYVARLLHKGPDAFLKKIGEEATEVVMAAKDADHGGDRAKMVNEVADLWFHSMVALAHYGWRPPTWWPNSNAAPAPAASRKRRCARRGRARATRLAVRDAVDATEN